MGIRKNLNELEDKLYSLVRQERFPNIRSLLLSCISDVAKVRDGITFGPIEDLRVHDMGDGIISIQYEADGKMVAGAAHAVEWARWVSEIDKIISRSMSEE